MILTKSLLLLVLQEPDYQQNSSATNNKATEVFVGLCWVDRDPLWVSVSVRPEDEMLNILMSNALIWCLDEL